MLNVKGFIKESEFTAIAVIWGALFFFLSVMVAYKEKFFILEFYLMATFSLVIVSTVTYQILNLYQIRLASEERQNILLGRKIETEQKGSGKGRSG
ncbi:MAG: hypothetical protein HY892_01740 [Deltaproteobacteria bacterium]|nr:hypothetical protein [Deltaproteobacteria bacterium]